jgi:1,4-alpha-glucan branching enzyme
VISLIRRARDPHDWVAVVLNWTPIVRRDYRIGVPEPGYYRELINTDASLYGGGNVGNQGGVATEDVPAHGHAQSIRLTLPPLGGLILKKSG